MTQIGLKEFRKNLDKYHKKIKQGESFIVMRKSEMLFKLSPINEGNWEEIIDFTQLQKGGVDIKHLIERL